MEGALRKAIRNSFMVVLLVAAVGVGYVAHGAGRATPQRATHIAAPVKLTAANLLRAAATANAGIYLQFDGVTGTAGGSHTKDMPITSFQFGVGRPASVSAGTCNLGTPSVSEITLTHQADKYSVPLLDQSLRGDGSGNAVVYLYHVNAGAKLVDLLEFDLGHAAVTQYSMSSGGEIPSESISLNFTSITMVARFGTPAQTVSYDLLTQS